MTLYLDALMNQESTVSLQDKRLRFIEDVGKAIAVNYDLQLNVEFAYLTGRYLTSLPLAPRSAAGARASGDAALAGLLGGAGATHRGETTGCRQ
ncbi:hypothetical protein LNP74_04240 [Klebsiella pneumoniae subsp. pneumoniae]|nr:hypothetical protein [Klebsiella pneumoniae subsp. pneumoniae]